MVFESGYKFQAKATTEFGIEFRSKLEAQWAYYFQSRGLDWQYADHAWYDFIVNGINIEVKPYAEGMLFRAAERVPENEILVIVFGYPPKKNWSERFSSGRNFESVHALSVFRRKEFRNGVLFAFRDASVGIYNDDMFFAMGLNRERMDGEFMIYKDESVSVNLRGECRQSVCPTLRGLISKEQKQIIMDYEMKHAKNVCDNLR